ncbi:MAG: T9SS type A sorting domain-containing protein, partial [Calditrichia bacterium]|nr:T9SS type A sorting domain-containing protein [Calditrichia bacterium]
ITRDAERFDVEDGYSVPTYGPATITLQPGWNQIGNPFAFTVNWYNITNSSMVNPPYYWNGDSYEYDVALIAPWEGYFVYSPQPADIDLLVLPVEAAFLKKTASGFSDLLNDEFVIQLKAKGTKSGLKDEQNFVGMRTFSGNGFDVHDYPEAPAIINNLNLSVLENDTLYAGNFKSISSEGACWNLQLTSSKKESEVIIDLQFFNELPESFKIYFLDLDYKCMILVKGNKAIVDWDDLNVRNLKLIVGKESYVNRHSENIPLIPVKFTLSQNYPNPFNPETTIRYTLAKQCQVKIEIYNILGQKINILVNKEQSTGNHFISWSGKNRTGHKVGSGVYFYRVMTDDFTAVRKMILLR